VWKFEIVRGMVVAQEAGAGQSSTVQAVPDTPQAADTPQSVDTTQEAQTLQSGDKGGEAANNGQPTAPGFSGMWIWIAVFIGIFYFFIIRPQSKREKQRREMISSIRKGDKVITNGGIHGTIVGLREKTVVLRISEDPLVKMEFVRGAIARVLTQQDEEENAEQDDS